LIPQAIVPLDFAQHKAGHWAQCNQSTAGVSHIWTGSVCRYGCHHPIL